MPTTSRRVSCNIELDKTLDRNYVIRSESRNTNLTTCSGESQQLYYNGVSLTNRRSPVKHSQTGIQNTVPTKNETLGPSVSTIQATTHMRKKKTRYKNVCFKCGHSRRATSVCLNPIVAREDPGGRARPGRRFSKINQGIAQSTGRHG